MDYYKSQLSEKMNQLDLLKDVVNEHFEKEPIKDLANRQIQLAINEIKFLFDLTDILESEDNK